MSEYDNNMKYKSVQENKRMVYCTLFGSNYADKGIVMIKSLIREDGEAKIYLLCMDNLCEKMIRALPIDEIIIIRMEDFEDAELLCAKGNRNQAEYCWTCTGKLIKYVIVNFSEMQCTYVDSDLFFYSDPKIIIEEMNMEGAAVQVVSHRFPPNSMGKDKEKQSGKNCVQFNTFTNKPESMQLLGIWIEQCLLFCSASNIGDQKYTDTWGDYPFVNVSRNIGAGVAPWNISRFKVTDKREKIIYDRYSRTCGPLVFYHFQGIVYKSRYEVQIAPLLEYWIIDLSFLKELYTEYLTKVEEEIRFLEEKFNYSCLIKLHPSQKEENKNKSVKMIISEYRSAPIKEVIKRTGYRLIRTLRSKKSIIIIPNENTTEERNDTN